MSALRPLVTVTVLVSFVARSAEPPADAPLKRYAHEEAVLLDDGVRISGATQTPGYFGGGIAKAFAASRLGQLEAEGFEARTLTGRLFAFGAEASFGTALFLAVMAALPGVFGIDTQSAGTIARVSDFLLIPGIVLLVAAYGQFARADAHLHRAVQFFNEDLAKKLMEPPAPESAAPTPSPVTVAPAPVPAPSPGPAPVPLKPSCTAEQLTTLLKSGLTREQVVAACPQ